ncbi:MAG: polysaccharide deacetylase family protein, partial [Phycisphaerae bacterium]|nr:polysaccharide deacetylase family protein [Phycisphaerae bacterium]
MTRQAEQSAPPADDATGVPHIITFDVEEYFQVEAAADGGTRPEQWDSFEKRLAPCVERILRLLSDHGASATFFVLGWVARHEREVVRIIAKAGHEIASHGMYHGMLGNLTPEQFRRELLDSRRLLEDISGNPVVG